MTGPRFDNAACETLAGCIQEIERNTDAELVVVVRARSASYAHADYLFGAVLAFVVLLVILLFLSHFLNTSFRSMSPWLLSLDQSSRGGATQCVVYSPLRSFVASQCEQRQQPCFMKRE